MSADTAHHAPAPEPAIDYDRVLRVILAIEGNPWNMPGGGYGFMPYSWREETTLPYVAANSPTRAAAVAKMRLLRFKAIAVSKGIAWTPKLCFESWRRGITGALQREADGTWSDYAQRAENLFNDPTFK